MNAKTLRWWSSELRRSARSSSKFVDVTAVVAPAQDAPGLELVIRDSVRVRVSSGFDAQLLRAVVAALEPR